MDKLKPCPSSETAREIIEALYRGKYDNERIQSGAYEVLIELCDAFDRRPAPENKPLTLCGEDENFIQTKYGYCFYSLSESPFVYNLYVHPQYRRRGHSRVLLKLVTNEIRKSGYSGRIRIQAEPRESSIRLKALIKYYRNMGFVIYASHKPEVSK